MISLLSDIIDSNSQSAVLGFLLIAPGRAFSAKELSLRLKLSVDAVDKAASSLTKQDYLKSFQVNNTVLYMLNLRHPQVPLLKQELLKSEKPWDDELFTNLRKLGQLTGIFLSGLFVGQNQPPVDLLLVGKANLQKLDAFLKNSQKLFGRELNYSIMGQEEFVNRRDTFDRFLKDIFDYPHIVVLDESSKPKKSLKKK